MRRSAPLLAVLAALLLLPSVASAQATRTWVSGVGDDFNPCSRTAPCKTFAGAIAKTATGGEIDVLDPGGYGTLTITKSITVDGTGTMASALSSGGLNGFSVNITPSGTDPHPRVVLRNLQINGAGATPGLNGVTIRRAESVVLDGVDISRFSNRAVDVRPLTTEPLSVVIQRSSLHDLPGDGIGVQPQPGGAVDLLLRDTSITGARGFSGQPGVTGTALIAGGGARVFMTRSTVFDNVFGLRRTGDPPGEVQGFCDNAIGGNGTDGDPPGEEGCQRPEPVTVTQTVTSPPPPPVTVTQTVVVPPPPVTVSAPVGATAGTAVKPVCVVPELVGLTPTRAGRGLRAAGCALGRVTRARVRRSTQVGRVTRQARAGGTKAAAGTTVAVTVGRR